MKAATGATGFASLKLTALGRPQFLVSSAYQSPISNKYRPILTLSAPNYQYEESRTLNGRPIKRVHLNTQFQKFLLNVQLLKQLLALILISAMPLLPPLSQSS